MRALIFELRPESLEQEGLITTLNKQALSLQARYGIQVETTFCDEPNLPLDVKESLYRIAREALHNTVKHAQATSVRLSMIQTDNAYRLEVQDNGLGFDANQTFAGHLGLKSMRERTMNMGGLLEIASAIGKGTTITVTISTVSS
jgi:signal transduction histidine kinase